MAASGINAPAFIIRLEVEAAPLVILDSLNEGEDWRIRDWLRAHPGYAELVDRALELRAEEKAA